MKIQLGKNYTTRDGRTVILYTTQSPLAYYPVIGVMQEPSSGKWGTGEWTADGGYYAAGSENEFDLVEKKKEVWVVLKDNGGMISFHASEESAQKYCDTICNTTASSTHKYTVKKFIEA